MARILSDGRIEQLQSSGLFAPLPAQPSRRTPTRRLRGVLASAPLTVPHPHDAPPTAASAASAADTSDDFALPQGLTLLLGDRNYLPDIADRGPIGSPHSESVAYEGKMLLAVAAYEDVVHVVDVRWAYGRAGIVWNFRMKCYDAYDLLKRPSVPLPRGSAAQAPSLAKPEQA